MENLDALIIGAGPAGLMAGPLCSAGGLKTCILEKNGSAGRKLLISGSGRCNMTHAGTPDDFLTRYGEGGRFTRPALKNFSSRALRDFFLQKGLETVELENGKIFPVTMKSRDVLGVLLDECSGTGTAIRYSEPVLKISRREDRFQVSTSRGDYSAAVILIATGGMSYASTGSTGDGYGYAEKLGLRVTETRPALVSLIMRDFPFSACAGISIPGAELSISREGKKIRTGSGDVLFTHRGLSGPGILDLSRYVYPGDVLAVRLVPFRDPSAFEKKMARELSLEGKKLLKNSMASYGIPERLAEALMAHAGISGDTRCSQAGRETRKALADLLCELPFTVEKTAGYDDAMATTGGISRDEIQKNTMQSKIVPGLFFAGEVIDVDGDTGGYNLQFAFSSGVLAGMNMVKYMKKGG